MGGKELLYSVAGSNVSDIFVTTGLPVMTRENKILKSFNDTVLDQDMVYLLICDIYNMAGRSMVSLNENLDDDFSVCIQDVNRFRVNVFRDISGWVMILRMISYDIPDFRDINIPEQVIRLSDHKSGLVLITGVAGSGKSTTLACMVEHINHTRSCHIITLEDPVEYVHLHDKAIINQRELGSSLLSYKGAVRSALRECPDVILLGEMRDHETMAEAITAAEAGILVLSTLHTESVSTSISRIIDVFPAGQQTQIRYQLSQILRGVSSQKLLAVEDGLIPAFEMLEMNHASGTMIRENRLHQLFLAMHCNGRDYGWTMDDYLMQLYRNGKISENILYENCVNVRNVQLMNERSLILS